MILQKAKTTNRDDEEHRAPTICHSEGNFALEAGSACSLKADSVAYIWIVQNPMENGNEKELNPILAEQWFVRKNHIAE